METNMVARLVKAATAILAVVGVVVSPEHQDQITAGSLAIYAIMSAIQAKLGK